ncbi:alpha/beta hydrolase [Kribbella sp. CA-293567]|uniref:alpha/beta hydrolase n=1 Tax=Kribbella sp. CA-293567 TaxID=3002436 RepID=UPI0022DD0C55|nr:alpha/beta hydrolase [Kribbella sp. CA-293567]WBQ06018.1 alpha/beta hydrolase [Kribbella sp. CA-293567]
MKLRSTTWGVVGGLFVACLTTLPASAAPPAALKWTDCEVRPTEDPELVRGSKCATLQVPVDWNRPAGPTFGLVIARRTAKIPAARVGTLFFAPGGPGDSGVDRIRTGMTRFPELIEERFDIVSFDPRGIARSNPVVCSAALLAQQPSPVIADRAAFEQTIRYNRDLAQDCRANTGPLYDHVDTLQSVRDVEAIRAALGESKLTFHGSSYGTLLGQQYAERYPHRLRALVLESVFDHGDATTGRWLDDQAATVQDSFSEFVKWCKQTTTCSLHGRDISALWADLVARAARGELPDPRQSALKATPYSLTFGAFRQLYEPRWAALANLLKRLDESAPPTGEPPVPTGLAPNPLAPFCRDLSLPVRTYGEFAAHLRRIARNTADLKLPPTLMAVTNCLGLPKAPNPQRDVEVHGLRTPALLLNSLHDPATGYAGASSVARQLGKQGVLVTYEGWGHGVYNSGPCTQQAVNDYLVALKLPPRSTRCAAVPPTG